MLGPKTVTLGFVLALSCASQRVAGSGEGLLAAWVAPEGGIWIGARETQGGHDRGGDLQSGVAHKQARELLAGYGWDRFPPLLIRALETWLDAEALYWKGDYQACKKGLDRLWAAYPPGDQAWSRARSPVREIFLGRYPCYYALRMLTLCVDWRLSRKGKPKAASKVVMGIVLPGRSRGLQPRTLEELAKAKGVEVEHRLDPSLLAQDHRILKQSLRLFREYVLALTRGRIALTLRFVPLPDLVVPVSVTARPRRHAGIARGGMREIWAAIPAAKRAGIEWWWVLYPSHVPGQFKDFERTEFITGGMGVGPDGASPCFISDDLWIVRKPPHLGKGPYTDIERRAYLPHWLQHEFFHHLYRTWPEFGLERKGHQWFDRASWPKDFVGRYEPDYYHESVVKRFWPRARPPLHIGLRYNEPDAADFAKIRIQAMLGSYEHLPVKNKWHRGKITRAPSKSGKAVLRWRNEAGVSWNLYPDLRHGVLHTGKKNPYYKQNPEKGRSFRIVLQRNASGAFTSTILGFRFQSTLYRRKGD